MNIIEALKMESLEKENIRLAKHVISLEKNKNTYNQSKSCILLCNNCKQQLTNKTR